MAENIVAGLFGLTPQMYGEQQRRSALQEGIDLAQLDPASRGAAMTYAGARGLGGAIAGAMGIEDPQRRGLVGQGQFLLAKHFCVVAHHTFQGSARTDPLRYFLP